MSVGLTLYCAQEEIAVSLGCCPNFAMGLLAKLDNMANGAADKLCTHVHAYTSLKLFCQFYLS